MHDLIKWIGPQTCDIDTAFAPAQFHTNIQIVASNHTITHNLRAKLATRHHNLVLVALGHLKFVSL